MELTHQNDHYLLSNGVHIPCIGYGTWQMGNGPETAKAVLSAIQAGYRHIDTAAAYGNEESVGDALQASKLPRDAFFITSKLANPDHGYEATRAAFQKTLEQLNTDYLDLYLIHWPNPVSCRDNWQEANAGTWRAMEEFYEQGKIRAIGVSNFCIRHLEPLLKTARIAPMVNQLSLSPGQAQKELCQFCREHGMLLEAYSPLGTGRVLQVPQMKAYAEKYGKSVAQICVRWSLQMGYLPLPKSTNPSRMAENAAVFDFTLSDEDVAAIAALDCGGLLHDPDTITF